MSIYTIMGFLTWSRVLSANHASSLHIHPQRIGAERNCHRHQEQAVHLWPRICLCKPTRCRHPISTCTCGNAGNEQLTQQSRQRWKLRSLTCAAKQEKFFHWQKILWVQPSLEPVAPSIFVSATIIDKIMCRANFTNFMAVNGLVGMVWATEERAKPVKRIISLWWWQRLSGCMWPWNHFYFWCAWFWTQRSSFLYKAQTVKNYQQSCQFRFVFFIISVILILPDF